MRTVFKICRFANGILFRGKSRRGKRFNQRFPKYSISKGDKKMIEYERTSMIDEIGRVFYCEGEVYRGIYQNAVEHVRGMFACGLIEELNSEGLIPHTQIAQLEIQKFPLVLHHERIRDSSYIQEWSFSMIQDAAVLLLDLEGRLLRYGYHLKDCHPYNVMFQRGKPLYVDIGSFIRFKEAGWAIREFYAYYDQILKLFSYVPAIARERLLSRSHIGVRYNLYYLNGVMHGDVEFKRIDDRINEIREINDFNELLKLMQDEEKTIKNYHIAGHSAWEDYQDGFIDDIADIDCDDNARFQKIVQICDDLNVSSVLELAANQGFLGRMLSRLPGIHKIHATDYDEGAVDKLYNYLKSGDCKDCDKEKIHPMVYDVATDFQMDISLKSFAERTCSDIVIACALMHHLILSQHINIDALFDKFSRLSKKYLIVEFMPLGLWGGGELPEIPVWYTESWFVRHMERRFSILKRERLSKNRVMFLGEKNDLQ